MTSRGLPSCDRTLCGVCPSVTPSHDEIICGVAAGEALGAGFAEAAEAGDGPPIGTPKKNTALSANAGAILDSPLPSVSAQQRSVVRRLAFPAVSPRPCF